MKAFHCPVVAKATLPNDMLFWVDVGPGVITLQYREGFIQEGALHDHEEWTRHCTRSEIFVQDDDGNVVYTGGTHLLTCPTEVAEEGVMYVHMDYSENLPDLEAFHPYQRGEEMLYVVRKSLIKPELVRDFNAVSDGVGVRKCILKPVQWMAPVDF